jgi:site-specific recombinase XerD
MPVEWEDAYETAVSLVRAVRVAKGDGEQDRSRLMRAAMIELLWSTGCTLDELVSLRRDDLDLAARRVCLAAEGGVRYAHLSDEAVAALRTYLRECGAPATDALFVEDVTDGAPLTAEGALLSLKDIVDATRLDAGSLSPDLFRDIFVRRAKGPTRAL